MAGTKERERSAHRMYANTPSRLFDEPDYNSFYDNIDEGTNKVCQITADLISETTGIP